MPTLAHARAEQLRCAALYPDPGAWLGMHDNFAEEYLMTHPPIIGLAGAKGSGKDTVAAILGEYGYRRVAFADALRQDVEDFLIARERGNEGPVIHAIRRNPAAMEAWPLCHSSQVWEKPTPAPVRVILQWYGQHKREHDSRYWIDRVTPKFNGPGLWVVSDVRPDDHGMLEPAVVRQYGGQVWLVTGRGGGDEGIAGHITEQVHLIEPDRILDNSGTLNDLRRWVATWVGV
jgi:hypothetical protein